VISPLLFHLVPLSESLVLSTKGTDRFLGSTSVDSAEAQLLIGLIEILTKDWYIARHDREVHLKSIIDIANTKTKEKSV